MDTPREDTSTFRFGRAVHLSVLQPDVYDRERIEIPAAYLTDGGAVSTGAKAKAWLAQQDNEAAVTSPEEHERCLRIRDAVNAHPDARTWLDHATHIERAIQWTAEVDGHAVECKARPDAVCARLGLLWDLKGTSSRGGTISLDSIARSIAAFRYHGQLAHYAAGLAMQPDPIIVDALGWVFVEFEAPHDVVVVQADDRMVKAGMALADKALRRYAQAQASGVWPGVAPRLTTISLPAWAERGE